MKKKNDNGNNSVYKLSGKTPNQNYYIQTIKNNDIILCDGPAGCGKSFCSIGLAIPAVLNKDFEKLILIKPLLEADNAIGTMPGDMKDKTYWHFYSLIEVIKEFIDEATFQKLRDQKSIELFPLGFWRGHTFKNSFIIVDEAQNLSINQIKLALTRLGFKSKMVLCGDTTQSDLRQAGKNPFQQCMNLLCDINNLEVVSLNYADIMRHGIISKILNRLDQIK